MIKKQHQPEFGSRLEKLSFETTKWIGTTQSILVHSILFVAIFGLYFIGFPLDQILLILTTAVSLEAIYLALFIQMSVNRQAETIEDVEEDIEDIQEDFGEIQEDVEGLEGNIKKMRENVLDLEQDVEDISEDIDKFHTEDDASEERTNQIQSAKSLQNIEKELITLSNGFISLKDDLEVLKKNLP